MREKNWLMRGNDRLPADVEGLPTITAEHWVTIDADPMLFIEGPAFDRAGNLYVCCSLPIGNVVPRIYKIAPSGASEVLLYTPGIHVMGMAIHKNGHLFIAALQDGFIVVSPDGHLLEHFQLEYGGQRLVPNDLTFTPDGAIYFTDFRGNCSNPCGGIYRLRPEDSYRVPERIIGGLMMPNGLAFTPDCRKLWIGESGGNAIWEAELGPDGRLAALGVPLCCLYRNSGCAMPDGSRMDGAGYYYQAIQRGGRVLVLDPAGVPAGNIVVPDRMSGRYDMTPNLAVRPDKNEACMLASGSAGINILRFPTVERAPALYSHM